MLMCSPRRISALRRDIALPHIMGRPVAVHDNIEIFIFSDESRFCEGPDNIWVGFMIGDWNDTALRCAEKSPKGVWYGELSVQTSNLDSFCARMS